MAGRYRGGQDGLAQLRQTNDDSIGGSLGYNEQAFNLDNDGISQLTYPNQVAQFFNP